MANEFAPINFPNLNPFHISKIQFDHSHLGNLSSSPINKIEVNHSSVALNDSNKNERLILDGEITKLSLFSSLRYSENFNLMIEIPFFKFSEGFMDKHIKNWHKFFGLSDGSRLNQPLDRLLFEYESISKNSISDSFFGIGDIKISSSLNISYQDKNNLFLLSAVELPSGSKKKNLSNGQIDFYSSLVWKNKFKNIHSSSYVGVAYSKKNALFYAKDNNLIKFFGSALSYKPRNFFDYNNIVFKTSLKISDKYYSSGLDSLGDYSVLIGLGATISLNDYFISIGFSEDLKVNSIPDITFVSSLQKRF
mgnify:FL=1